MSKELQARTEADTVRAACEGNCLETHSEHKGEVVAVIISGNGWQKTKFNYCQNAIEEDERRGFFVRQQLTDAAARVKI